MEKYLSIIFSLLLLLGCTTGPSGDMKRRNLGEYFVGTGVVRYFLTELPDWANFSQSGRCKRDVSAKFFKFDTLRQSFSLSYEEVLQFQYMYNAELIALKKNAGVDHIPFKEEEKLFYELSDKIQAGIRTFQVPKFKRVHLIWVDRAISSKKHMAELKKNMASSEMGKGHPVFVSLCMGRQELEVFAKQNFKNAGARLISFELFSLYNEKSKRLPYFSLIFNSIFKKNQKLHLYIPKGETPIEFRGNYSTHYF